jgi:hypothetical protein
MGGSPVKRDSKLWKFLNNAERKGAFILASCSTPSTTSDFYADLEAQYFEEFHWSMPWGEDSSGSFLPEPVTPEEFDDARRKRDNIRDVCRALYNQSILF